MAKVGAGGSFWPQGGRIEMRKGRPADRLFLFDGRRRLGLETKLIKAFNQWRSPILKWYLATNSQIRLWAEILHVMLRRIAIAAGFLLAAVAAADDKQ
jgi:hypothetical protein